MGLSCHPFAYTGLLEFLLSLFRVGRKGYPGRDWEEMGLNRTGMNIMKDVMVWTYGGQADS
jgi:hypothetical protein